MGIAIFEGMIVSSLADTMITGPAVTYFAFGMAVPVGGYMWLLGRTRPASAAINPVSGWLAAAAAYLWQRTRTRTTVVLAAITAAGAAICCASTTLAFVTFTSPPLFPGDPFAGPAEHDPTARGLALLLGVIIGLLAFRRLVGGEGNTVGITVIAAGCLEIVAALAIADYVSNSQPLTGPYADTVAPGPGLFVLPIGATVALIASALDVVLGLRRAFRQTSADSAVLPPMDESSRQRGPISMAATSAPAYRPGTILARSFGASTLFVLVVAVGALSPVALVVPLILLASSTERELYLYRQLRRPFRLDKGIVFTVAAGVAILGGVRIWELVRADSVLVVPSDAHPIAACAPSLNVPDQGNQVNRSIAGSTTVMTAGSKIYVEDAPTGDAALTALSIQGPGVVCAAGGSGFGETLIGLKPGVGTLYVRTRGGPTYRIGVRVNP
ncbi:MAG TPA: hypothetical protein VF155_05620 [Candidatus Dormibacteraeota bacterium]